MECVIEVREYYGNYGSYSTSYMLESKDGKLRPIPEEMLKAVQNGGDEETEVQSSSQNG